MATTRVSTVPMLIGLDGSAGAKVRLNRPLTIVGSKSHAHLRIVSQAISGSHALLLNIGNHIFLRDLMSRTHVYVNDKPIREQRLKHGDVLRFGDARFRLSDAGVLRQSPARLRAPAGSLRVESDSLQVLLEPMLFVLGRQEGADLVLKGDEVSKAHAVIFDYKGRRFLRDLHSRSGTLVNGTRIRTVELQGGETITIGRTNLRLELSETSGQVASVAPRPAAPLVAGADAGLMADRRLSPESPALEATADSALPNKANGHGHKNGHPFAWRDALASELVLNDTAEAVMDLPQTDRPADNADDPRVELEVPQEASSESGTLPGIESNTILDGVSDLPPHAEPSNAEWAAAPDAQAFVVEAAESPAEFADEIDLAPDSASVPDPVSEASDAEHLDVSLSDRPAVAGLTNLTDTFWAVPAPTASPVESQQADLLEGLDSDISQSGATEAPARARPSRPAHPPDPRQSARSHADPALSDSTNLSDILGEGVLQISGDNRAGGKATASVPSKPRRWLMKAILLLVVGLIAVGVLLAAAWWFYHHR